MTHPLDNLTNILNLAIAQVKLMIEADNRPTEEECQELYKQMWELIKNIINLE